MAVAVLVVCFEVFCLFCLIGGASRVLGLFLWPQKDLRLCFFFLFSVRKSIFEHIWICVISYILCGFIAKTQVLATFYFKKIKVKL